MDIAINLAFMGGLFGLASWLLTRRTEAVAARVWRLAQQRQERDAQRAEAALLEAVAQKVAPALAAIRDHEARLEAHLRAELADAEARAQSVAQHAADAREALEAACQLVHELGALIGDLAPAAESARRSRRLEGRGAVEMPRDQASCATSRASGVKRLEPRAALVAAGLTRPSFRCVDQRRSPPKATLLCIPQLSALDEDDPDACDDSEGPRAVRASGVEEVMRWVSFSASSPRTATLASIQAMEPVEAAPRRESRS